MTVGCGIMCGQAGNQDAARVERMASGDRRVERRPSLARRDTNRNAPRREARRAVALVAGDDDLPLLAKHMPVLAGSIEQLAPFPYEEVARLAAAYPNAEITWVQEAPKNMGPWTWLQSRFRTAVRAYGLESQGRSCRSAPHKWPARHQFGGSYRGLGSNPVPASA